MQHWHRGCVDAGLKIAYFSKTLGLKASAQSLYEKSSILAALKKWRHYLLGSKVIIRTDQQTLKFITSQRLTEGVQHFFFDSASSINWLSSTIWLNTTKEKKIKWQMADALSRRNQDHILSSSSQPSPHPHLTGHKILSTATPLMQNAKNG